MARPKKIEEQSQQSLLAHGRLSVDRTSLESSEGERQGLLHELDDEGDVLHASDETKTVKAYTDVPSASLPLLRFSSRSRKCLLVSLTVLSLLIATLLGGYFHVVHNVVPADGQSPPFYPTPRGGTDPSWVDAYAKAAAFVSRMSLMEKVNVTTGTNWMSDLCVGNTAPATGVGFPALCLQDGPLGLRFVDHATSWPAGITVGATWNKELMYERGRLLGREAREKGINVLLGPLVGPLGRMPAGGRNWEGFGPDPVLQGIAAARTVEGIQAEGVVATIKHFVGNEQEHFRQSWEWGLPNAMSVYMDDRTLHEMYGWPFQDAIKAGVGSLMCSYNMVNASYACGNSWLLNGVVKHEMGFQGFVQSDWLAKRSGVASALAGLDMDMPGDGLYWAQGNTLWGQHLTMAVLNESLPVERLDDMTLRIVAAYYQMGQDDEKKWPKQGPNGGDGPNFSSWTQEKEGRIYPASDDETTAVVNQHKDVQGFGKEFHGRVAKEVAAEGIVLLKNEKAVLPLNSTQLGTDARALGRKHKIGIFGEDAGPSKGGPNACLDRSCNDGTLAVGWGSGASEFPYLVTPLQALESAFDFEAVELTVDLTNAPGRHGHPPPKDQDICLVFANADAGEGFHSWNGINGDRNDLYLQKNGDELITLVANACGGPTIVIIHTVGPVIMDRWIDHPNIKAVLNAGLPGQESGNALTDVLFGRSDASGRLPYTIAKQEKDYGSGSKIMYYPNGALPTQEFSEGLLIDYRHLDKYNISPRYEFGFGLSYTTFSLSLVTLRELKPKAPLADPLPGQVAAPTIEANIPNPSDALFPAGFRKLKNRSYPYLEESDLPNARGNGSQYPYPNGYTESAPQPRSRGSGGFQGGNPSLWDAHVAVSVTVTNTGSRPGKEVVQVYVRHSESRDTGADVDMDDYHNDDDNDPEEEEEVRFPTRVLRQFEKTRELQPGQSQVLEMKLNRRDLSYWSTRRQEWVMPTRDITVEVGTSSRRIAESLVW